MALGTAKNIPKIDRSSDLDLGYKNTRENHFHLHLMLKTTDKIDRSKTTQLEKFKRLDSFRNLTIIYYYQKLFGI